MIEWPPCLRERWPSDLAFEHRGARERRERRPPCRELSASLRRSTVGAAPGRLPEAFALGGMRREVAGGGCLCEEVPGCRISPFSLVRDPTPAMTLPAKPPTSRGRPPRRLGRLDPGELAVPAASTLRRARRGAPPRARRLSRAAARLQGLGSRRRAMRIARRTRRRRRAVRRHSRCSASGSPTSRSRPTRPSPGRRPSARGGGGGVARLAGGGGGGGSASVRGAATARRDAGVAAHAAGRAAAAGGARGDGAAKVHCRSRPRR